MLVFRVNRTQIVGLVLAGIAAGLLLLEVFLRTRFTLGEYLGVGGRLGQVPVGVPLMILGAVIYLVGRIMDTIHHHLDTFRKPPRL